RRNRIDDDLSRAAQLKAEAETVMAAYQQTLAAARAAAQAAVKDATDRFAAEAAERHRQLSDTLAQQTTAAERQIAAAKEQALSAYRRKQQEAAAEADLIITHAKQEAERIAAQSLRDLEVTLRRRRLLAQERIAQEEAKAVAEIRAIAVDIAISAARQVIAALLDEKRGAALIDDAIAALPRQLH